MPAPELVLGVIVPCYDEAPVVARRLANLAACSWPSAPRRHRLLVVDDGSSDGTAELAQVAARSHFAPSSAVTVEVLANVDRPGKPGALRTAIAHLAHEVDVIVLTDADVLFAADALAVVAGAFASDPRAVMATGAQTFVERLPADGIVSAEWLRGARRRGSPFDRATSVVRRLEGAFGRTFSVHGQLLAWRAGHGIAPRLDLAADDLELMAQARVLRPQGRRARVTWLAGARFFERKTPAGGAREEQALRRARAWFQAMERLPSPRGDVLDRAQFAAYRLAPALAPRAALVGAVLVTAACGVRNGSSAVAVVVLAFLAAALLPPVRALLRGLAWIERARRAERRDPLPSRWRMPRTSEG